MTQSITKFVNFEELRARGSTVATVIRLMMACNDLSLANEALAGWKQNQSPSRRHCQSGAKMYFVRLQFSHFFEALKVLDEIRETPQLYAVVQRREGTRVSFQRLEKFLPGGAERGKIEKLAGQIRHNLVFHYDQRGKLIRKALADRAARQEGRDSSITRGRPAYVARFNVADDVLDTIITRQIWRIPKGANQREEADKVAGYLHKAVCCFVDFSGEFVWQYFSRR